MQRLGGLPPCCVKQTLIIAAVFAQAAAFAAAPTALPPVTVGELSLEIRPRRGPVLRLRGLTVVEGGYLRLHSPDWKTTCLGLGGRASATDRLEAKKVRGLLHGRLGVGVLASAMAIGAAAAGLQPSGRREKHVTGGAPTRPPTDDAVSYQHP